jgi:hypothetical protein
MRKEDEMEMMSTLAEVAKMKAEFNLLKQAIINNLELDYSGKELSLRDSRLVVEVMYLIENDQMENLYQFKKNEQDAKDALASRLMENVEVSNG